MRDIAFEFNFTNLPEATLTGIMECVKEKKPFGLVSKNAKNVVVFSITHRKSWWVLNTGEVMAAYDYNDEAAFMNALSMQLLSHKNFVEAEALLQVEQIQKLLM